MRPFLVLTALLTGWILSVAPGAYGQAISVKHEIRTADILLEEGREALLDFRLEQADRYFTAFIRTSDDDAATGFYYLSLSNLARALLSEEEKYYDAFFTYSDSLARALRSARGDIWHTYLEAEAYFHRAFAFARQGSYRRAVLSARRSFRAYNRTLREDPTFYDAYRGRGMFKVILGSVPGGYRWILSLLGYSGDVQEGFAELQLAAVRGVHAREQSALLLAVADMMINESRLGALSRMEDLYHERPSSPALSYLYAFALLSHRQARAAEEVIRPHTESARSTNHFFIKQNKYYLADALFKQNRFEEALGYFDRFIATYEGEALMSQAYLKSGLSLEMLGRYPEARTYYASIEAGRDFDTDEFAVRRAIERLEGPMDARERNLVRGMNAQDGGRYEEAIGILSELFADDDAPAVMRAEAGYRLGRCFQFKEDYRTAISYYEDVAENPGDPSARWGPWSRYYAGEMYEALGMPDHAKRAYEASISGRANFDFRRALEQKVRTAMGRLG